MAYAQKLPAHVSPEDYLLLEERATAKHEYLDGVIYDWQGGGPSAMAGGGKNHNLVSLNVYRSIWNQLRGRPCKVFVADVKVVTTDRCAFFYPDVLVTCSEADHASPLVVGEPTLIVEVLSPSTELFDRREKFSTYQRFPSLESYVLVSPEQRTIEVFTRAEGWRRTAQTEAVRLMHDEVITLGSHDLRLDATDAFADL